MSSFSCENNSLKRWIESPPPPLRLMRFRLLVPLPNQILVPPPCAKKVQVVELASRGEWVSGLPGPPPPGHAGRGRSAARPSISSLKPIQCRYYIEEQLLSVPKFTAVVCTAYVYRKSILKRMQYRFAVNFGPLSISFVLGSHNKSATASSTYNLNVKQK